MESFFFPRWEYEDLVVRILVAQASQAAEKAARVAIPSEARNLSGF
jgi:hypothetical protein